MYLYASECELVIQDNQVTNFLMLHVLHRIVMLIQLTPTIASFNDIFFEIAGLGAGTPVRPAEDKISGGTSGRLEEPRPANPGGAPEVAR